MSLADDGDGRISVALFFSMFDQHSYRSNKTFDGDKRYSFVLSTYRFDCYSRLLFC